jgi:Putative zinc-finger
MCDFPESSPGIASRERSRHHELSELAAQLIAWLDHELPEAEAAVVEEHIRGCAECRSRVNTYECVSRGFDLYCEAIMAASAVRPAWCGSRAHSKVPRWVPVLAGTAAALGTLFIGLFVVFPRHRIEYSAAPVQTTTVSAVIASSPSPKNAISPSGAVGSPASASADSAARASATHASMNRPNVVRATAPGRTVRALRGEARAFQNRAFRNRAFQNDDWQFAQPAIQIAIPAEAMFPPGAVPEGVNFTADLTISADGSAQGLVLEPRVIGLGGSGGSQSLGRNRGLGHSSGSEARPLAGRVTGTQKP